MKMKMNMNVKAPAKINLALDIVGKLPDGYHQISTIFQQIPLFDELTFRKAATPEIRMSCHHPGVPGGEKNLVHRAALLLLSSYKNSLTYQKWPGLNIMLKKNIPVAAGLGGGSSDAAATLRALNALWNLEFSLEKLECLGAKIGMDVPFFLHGGTARATHCGEKIQPLPALRISPVLIIVPKNVRKLSTAVQYQKIDHYSHGLHEKNTKKLAKMIINRTPIAAIDTDFFHNDFDALYAGIFALLQKKLYKAGATAVHCCGSGPAFYALFTARRQMETAVRALQATRGKDTGFEWYCL